LGTNGDDNLVGTSGPDVIDGLRGSDIIRGGAGNDELSDYTGFEVGNRLDATRDAFYGGPGNDSIYASQHDRVYAGTGDDQIYANYVKRAQSIACGPGRDMVILNDDDPGLELRGCENVRVAYAG
jgi:Ca2+-binding RTX toxin-like protein